MTITLPTWIERLVGIDAVSGEGAAVSLEYVAFWPAWLVLLVTAFAVAMVVTLYWQGRRRASARYCMSLAAIRLILVAIVMIMLAQWTLTLKRTGLPYVAVLLDDSLSMTTVDHYGEKSRASMLKRLERAESQSLDLSRWNLAQTLLEEDRGAMLRDLAENHKLRVYFLTDMRPARGSDAAAIVEEIRSTFPTGQSTRLGEGVRAALDDLRGSTPAAIVLLTDGVNTDGPSLDSAADYARRRGVPMFLVRLGSDEPRRELKISDLLVDDVVFVNDVVNFEFQWTPIGYNGQKISIVLREKQKSAVLAKVEKTAGPDLTPQTVRIPYRPTQPGRFEFVIEALPPAGEAIAPNNRQSRIVDVRKQKIQTLLVQAAPSFEFRYLRNLLSRDETIALHTVLQEADTEHAQQDATALRGFPLRREDLFAYDVVIFGDVNPAQLSAGVLKHLADFVDQPGKGGSLVLIAGPSFMPAAYRDTPLAKLLPFRASAVKKSSLEGHLLRQGAVVEPTQLGFANPSMQLGESVEETREIWRNLPPLYWFLQLHELKPGVRVLAEATLPGERAGHRVPVFCFQYVGAGKVLFHATDETWRWRYRAGDRYFARYWLQTIRWLCRAKLADAGKPMILAADRREYVEGEPVRLRARFADERLAPAEDNGVTVVIELSGRQTQRLTLNRATANRGIFEGQLERPTAGDYHAWIVVPTLKSQAAVDFTVMPPAGEFADVRADAGELRRATQATGGRLYAFDSADRLLRDLPSGRQVPIESLPPVPLWNKWPLLAVFLGLLTAEWILRKRRGMV